MAKPTATALDIQIGERIRIRRRQLGMNQTELAGKLGLAYQQVQKYESGVNRVSAGRLPLIASALDVHVGYFYGHDDAAVGVDTAAAASSIGLLPRDGGGAGGVVYGGGPRMRGSATIQGARLS